MRVCCFHYSMPMSIRFRSLNSISNSCMTSSLRWNEGLKKFARKTITYGQSWITKFKSFFKCMRMGPHKNCTLITAELSLIRLAKSRDVSLKKTTSWNLTAKGTSFKTKKWEQNLTSWKKHTMKQKQKFEKQLFMKLNFSQKLRNSNKVFLTCSWK